MTSMPKKPAVWCLMLVVGSLIGNIGHCVMPPRSRQAPHRITHHHQQLVQQGIVPGLVGDGSGNTHRTPGVSDDVVAATTHQSALGRSNNLRARGTTTNARDRPGARQPSVIDLLIQSHAKASLTNRQRSPVVKRQEKFKLQCCRTGRKLANLKRRGNSNSCDMTLSTSRPRKWHSTTTASQLATTVSPFIGRNTASLERQLRRCVRAGRRSRRETRACCTKELSKKRRRRPSAARGGRRACASDDLVPIMANATVTSR